MHPLEIEKGSLFPWKRDRFGGGHVAVLVPIGSLPVVMGRVGGIVFCSYLVDHFLWLFSYRGWNACLLGYVAFKSIKKNSKLKLIYHSGHLLDTYHAFVLISKKKGMVLGTALPT